MSSGIAYDSTEGRAAAGAITAVLTGAAYLTSAEMAKSMGPFPRYKENINPHRLTARTVPLMAFADEALTYGRKPKRWEQRQAIEMLKSASLRQPEQSAC